jgi:hypothetical protein
MQKEVAMIIFISGLLLGAFLGLFVLAILTAARNN